MSDEVQIANIRMQQEIERLRARESALRSEVLRLGHRLGLMLGRCPQCEYAPTTVSDEVQHG